MRKGSRWQMLFLPFSLHLCRRLSLLSLEEGICLPVVFSTPFLLTFTMDFEGHRGQLCVLWTLNESDRLEMTRRAGVGG